MSNDNENATEYEFEPFESVFLRRLDQIVQLVGIAGYALRYMEGTARLTEVLHRPKEEIERAQELEALALEQVEADLPLLHSAAAVLLWGALEAAFRDFLVRWLVRYPSARVVPEFGKVRVRVSEYESFDTEDRMRYLVNILEKELGSALRPGVGRFECLLKPFDICPKISRDKRRDINELAAIRNVIVHRAGIVDARFIRLCPWLGLKEGESVVVGTDTFHRYVGAASEYTAAIIESAQDVARSSGEIRQPPPQDTPADAPQATGD